MLAGLEPANSCSYYLCEPQISSSSISELVVCYDPLLGSYVSQNQQTRLDYITSVWHSVTEALTMTAQLASRLAEEEDWLTTCMHVILVMVQ